MSLKVEDAVPPPHLFSGRSATWPSSYTSQAGSLGSSPALKSPQPPYTYNRMHESPMSSHDINNVPTGGWYDASITANDLEYTAYEHYNPHRSSVMLSPRSSTYAQGTQVPSSGAHGDAAAGVISPVPVYPQSSLLSESARQSVELAQTSDPSSQRSPSHVKVDSHGQQQTSHGSFSVLQSVPSRSSWSIDPLGIHTPSVQSDSPYANLAQHIQALRSGEGCMEMTLAAPQPRRAFTPIAPQPMETPRLLAAKRSRDEDELGEVAKRRRRSESTPPTQLELTEEDKLLLKLKEEESMPWKEIAARFQSDLGKQYQIPALQMRLKRLRERMRVWSEADVRALRMAHDYWAQNKFDIIAQKMVEFGAQERWTARQCAQKWAESDALPTPMPQYEQPAQHSFTPYSMSPAEPATSFLPYMHP